MPSPVIKLKKKQGFTLTEVIVTSVIIALLGIGLTSMMTWMFQSSKDGQSLSHLQDQANTVLEDVAHKVRNSTALQVSSGGKTIVFLLGGLPTDSLRIIGNDLYEGPSTYQIAGSSVALDGANSSFSVDINGRSARLDLVLKRSNQTFKVSSGYFRCRN